jgi:methylmalonyl-CoA/ethylmalonyl-CoA epimerase
MKGAYMVDISQLKSSYGKLQHVGVVVKDVEKAVTYLSAMGFGPFTTPGRPNVINVGFKGELHGKPAEWKTKIAFAKMGDVELEILEPSEGPQALRESLDKTGEGLHHLGFMTDNLDREIANFKKQGIKIWTMARQPNGGGFIYSEPTGVGGIAIEFRAMGTNPPK